MDTQQYLAGTFARRLPVVEIVALEVELIGFVKTGLPLRHTLIKIRFLPCKSVFALLAVTHQLRRLAIALEADAAMAIFLAQHQNVSGVSCFGLRLGISA